jgi:hypothetical protein
MLYYLYVKETDTGLKYLGSTTRNPYKYGGSGKYWNRYLRKHKEVSVKTKVLFQSEDLNRFKEKCLYYSDLFDVVNSEEWANLMPESGIDSTIGRVCSEQTRMKISISNKGRVFTKETIEKQKKNRKVRIGWHHSSATKKILSDFRKGRKLSVDTINKMREKTKGRRLVKAFKKVYQYNLDGSFIKEWSNMKDACAYYHADICNAASGRHKTAAGFLWRKVKYDSIEPYCKESKLIKPIYQYNIDGTFIKEWKSQKEIFKELGFKRTAILNAISDPKRTSNGYKWSYTKQDKLNIEK